MMLPVGTNENRKLEHERGNREQVPGKFDALDYCDADIRLDTCDPSYHTLGIFLEYLTLDRG